MMLERRERTPGITAKVAYLSRPATYPTMTQSVTVVESHMSWVFLTDCHAYKLKKPVRYDYLDFSTIEARRRDCEEEVRLNRRLAAEVYHGTVPLTIDQEGHMQLGGAGDTIDWLVKMRRLPAARMLNYAITHGSVHEPEVRKVGALLARFYLQAPPVEMTPAAYRRQLAENVRVTCRELARPRYALPAALLESVAAAQLAVLEREPGLFDRRVRTKRIIEAHGDLRPEHICLEDRPVIIDCLEFNRDFRILDTASELSYLALECERLGAAYVGDVILDTYSTMTGDRPPTRLVTFYKSYHAAMRAKIAVWHLKEPGVYAPATWTRKAEHYLHLASRMTQVVGGGDTVQ